MSFLARAACALALAALATGAAASPQASSRSVRFGSLDPSPQARRAAELAVHGRDADGMPFAIVDKQAARIFVFDAKGHLKGASAALLGQTAGDDSAPDVGLHTQQGHVPLEERTTPAGRFVSAPGENLKGERVVWVDYDAAFAIHRLRPGASRREREAKLASSDPLDHRASLGCVIVPVSFYKHVVQPVIGRSHAVIYVLPETQPLEGAVEDGL